MFTYDLCSIRKTSSFWLLFKNFLQLEEDYPLTFYKTDTSFHI